MEYLCELKPKFIVLVRSFSELKRKFPLFFILPSFIYMLATVYFIINPNDYIMDLINNNQGTFLVYVYVTTFLLLLIGVFIVTLIMNYLDKKNFEATQYKIFQDRIEIEEGFINHKHNVVMFHDIKEIHLNQNFIQKKYNIGSIIFDTEASNSTPKSIFAKGIEFTDIENPQEIYVKMKEIHERG